MKFGTDGIRGRAGEAPIDEAGAHAVGRAAVAWARAHGGRRVVVGSDTRPSSFQLRTAVCHAVTAAGGIAVDAGTMSSPALGNAVEAGLGDVGVMITASHNPARDNGFKMLGPGGRKPTAAQTAQVELWLQEAPVTEEGGGSELGHLAALEAYKQAFAERVGDLSALAGKRIGVDFAHGGASVAKPMLEALCPTTIWAFMGQGDGTINDGVGSENPQALGRFVIEQGLDAGIAVDGDGDRLVLVDEQGRKVPGDAVTWLLAQREGVKKVAVTVMSNAALEGQLGDREVIRTPVGDKHLARAIADEGVHLGAEESGHILFHDGLVGGDGLFAGLRALQQVFATHDSLSGALEGFVLFPKALTKVTVSRRPPLDEVFELQQSMTRLEPQLGGGRIFLRYSGTEPVLRLLVEGRTEDAVQQVSEEITRTAEEVLG